MYSSFQDMPVWQRAMDVAEAIFYLSESFPPKEDYGLTSQIRRSALSISGNIAEAFGRHHLKDKLNFYYIARGSLTETQSHLIYAKRVGYLNEQQKQRVHDDLLNVHKELNKIIFSFKNTSSLQPKP